MRKTHTCVVPEALKSRLSTLWIKCFDMLSHSSVPSTSVQIILNDAQLKQEFASSGKAESLEEILLLLTEEDAVLDRGHLKLQPIFFSLPKIVQTRFLYLVQHNALKICSHQLSLFVNKLESVEVPEGSWVKNTLAVLRRYLDDERIEKDSMDHIDSADYKFSTVSQNRITDLLQKLKREDGKSLASPSYASKQPSCHNQDLESQNCQKVVDVIIIDDDEESQEFPDILRKNEFTKSTDLVTTSSTLNKEKDTKITTGVTSSNSLNNVNDTKTTTNVSRPTTLSRAGNIKDGFLIAHSHEVSDLSTATDPMSTVVKRASSPKFNESSVKVPKLAGQEVAEPKYFPSVDRPDDTSCQDQSFVPKHKALTDSIKAHLEKLKEIYFGDNKSLGTGSNKLTFLLELSSSELEAACDYLKLSDQTEECLLSLCDSVPWAELEYSSSFSLFSGCLFQKITSYQSHVSQTLMTAIVSVLRGQPKAVLDLLIQAVHHTQSNEFQCQLLATLCKDAFSQEWLCYLIKQLSEEPEVLVNDNLLSVLQAVIDRRADLDERSLTSFLALQVRGCQALATSPRFGKCLMACLTKYGKKMTTENLAHFSSLVDTHGSNFKPALNAAFKRLNS